MLKPVFFLGIIIFCVGCASTTKSPTRPAAINHVVFFKLNNPAETDALLADCDALLKPIPGVTSYYSGKHLDTGRATVENNYDAGLYLGFANKTDYADYVKHPDHVQLVSRWKPKLQWYRVYDVYDPSP